MKPGLYPMPAWARFLVIPVQIVRLYRCDRGINPLTWLQCGELAWHAFRIGLPMMEVPERAVCPHETQNAGDHRG